MRIRTYRELIKMDSYKERHTAKYPIPGVSENAHPTQPRKERTMTTPKKYRKKPVEIEAMQLIGAAGDTAQVLYWMAANRYPMLIGDYTRPEALRYDDQVPGDDSRPDKGTYIDPATGDLMIRTLEGDMRAAYGDYIIKGVQGEFYPCKTDIFEATYDAMEAQK